jgi:hypothetical protein
VNKKEPAPTGRKQKDLKASSANLFINIIILILSLLIIFIGYSIYIKYITPPPVEVDAASMENASAIVQLEVMNGCGVSGVADKFTDYLRKRNFDVVQMGNYISFDIDKSMVIDRTGKKANAYKVAEALGIERSNVIQQLNNDYFLDVSLIIGRDFNSLKPFK